MYSNKSHHSMYIQNTMDQSYNNESDIEVKTNPEEISKSFSTEM